MEETKNQADQTVSDIIHGEDSCLQTMITDPQLHQFVEDTLVKYGTCEKVKASEKQIHIMLEMFEHMDQINEQSTSAWLQPLVAAGYIGDLFFNPDMPASSLAMARDVLTKPAEEAGVAESWMQLIFQTIEGQLGAKTPIPACQPHGDHPIMIFAWGRWIEKNRKELLAL